MYLHNWPWIHWDYDVEIMECASNPCENNETCNDLVGYFTCYCMPGYANETCAIDINDTIFVATMKASLI